MKKIGAFLVRTCQNKHPDPITQSSNANILWKVKEIILFCKNPWYNFVIYEYDKTFFFYLEFKIKKRKKGRVSYVGSNLHKKNKKYILYSMK